MTPARNRVTPLGDIEAIDLRGAWTGNRGKLHKGREIVRFHGSDLWIICALQRRERWSEQWQPNHYTFLYFHDEAVALAAGHRPCAECRRDSYNAYRQAWAQSLHTYLPTAKQMNTQLHSERIERGTHRRQLHPMTWSELPNGTFVLIDERPSLVLDQELIEWTHEGYGARKPRPMLGQAPVITPPGSVAVLRAGYPVQIDPSARTSSPTAG